MSRWQSKHWSPGTVRLWRDTEQADVPCNVEYAYSDGSIASVSIHMGAVHTIRVTWCDGRTAEWTDSALNIGGVYQQQFGLTVSQDGRFIFVQTWEKGLHCLNAATGGCIWRSKSRRGVTSLMVSAHTLAVLQQGHALLLMDIETGDVLKEKRPARAFDFYPLSPTHFICQTSARQWEIIRADDLVTVQFIPHKLFPDTTGDTPWCIRDVWLEDGQLWCNAFRSVSLHSTDVIDESISLPVQVQMIP